MIKLTSKALDECKALREEVYSKCLTNDGILSTDDKIKCMSFLDKLYTLLGNIKIEDYLLDMKCGIIWTREEVKKGIKNLHNHETGEIY